MIRYENLIMEELEGEFPRDKYNYLLELKAFKQAHEVELKYYKELLDKTNDRIQNIK